MGLLSGMQTIAAAQKIKNGKTAKLSLAQICSLIINLIDARNNLSEEQFAAIRTLYNAYQTQTEKRLLDYDGYLDAAINIIQRFDKLAPYEKYSGNSEEETLLLLQLIRKS